jgi:uncharacterized membrane protein YcaP (DUF421 family)
MNTRSPPIPDLNIIEGWPGIVRVALAAIAAYVVLIICVRVSGKRTLSQLNAFDLIVTIALGSMLSSTILDSSLPFVEGVTGVAVLILMQVILARLTSRFRWADQLVKAQPIVLVHNGVMDKSAMASVDITEAEVISALRLGHWDQINDVKSVTLETNGGLTVVYQANIIRK